MWITLKPAPEKGSRKKILVSIGARVRYLYAWDARRKRVGPPVWLKLWGY